MLLQHERNDMDGAERAYRDAIEVDPRCAVAHHNLAVEQEALHLPEEATRSFAEAAAIAHRELGAEHPMASTLRGAYEAHMQSLDQREADRAAHLASRGVRPPPDPAARRAAEARKAESVERHVIRAREREMTDDAPSLRFLPLFDRLRAPRIVAHHHVEVQRPDGLSLTSPAGW